MRYFIDRLIERTNERMIQLPHKKNLLKITIRLLHYIVVGYFVLIPIVSNDPNVLRDYVLYSAFLWAHWITNQDTCALTLMESYLWDLPSDHTFFGNLVSPVYKVSSRQIYLGHALLVALALYKLR